MEVVVRFSMKIFTPTCQSQYNEQRTLLEKGGSLMATTHLDLRGWQMQELANNTWPGHCLEFTQTIGPNTAPAYSMLS